MLDVTNAEQARIAEDAGAVAVMALERVPAGKIQFYFLHPSHSTHPRILRFSAYLVCVCVLCAQCAGVCGVCGVHVVYKYTVQVFF